MFHKIQENSAEMSMKRTNPCSETSNSKKAKPNKEPEESINEPNVHDFYARTSEHKLINTRWAQVVRDIRTHPLPEGLAIQSYNKFSQFFENFFYLLPTTSGLKAYIEMDFGALRRIEVSKDVRVEAWWTENRSIWRNDPPEEGVSWDTEFFEYLEEELVDSEEDIPLALTKILQEYFDFPFVGACFQDIGMEPQSGPKNINKLGMGDIGEEYACLADVLDGHFEFVADARCGSICCSKTGKLIYGQPWNSEDPCDESDESDEDNEGDQDSHEDQSDEGYQSPIDMLASAAAKQEESVKSESTL
jgi:hypothetical protein